MEVINTEKAYNLIRDRILAGIYRPGMQLVTRDLSKQTGVSRTPVRDALRQLEADGLVTIRAHVGATVKTMDLEQFKDLCELRQGLETHSAGLAAANRNRDDLVEIRRALTAMREIVQNMVQRGDPGDRLSDLIREDVRFHYAIATASKNKLLKQEILRLNLVHRVVTMEPITASTGEIGGDSSARLRSLNHHKKIYDAIEAQKIAAAKAAMSRSIQDAIDVSVHVMATSEEAKRDRNFGLAVRSR